EKRAELLEKLRKMHASHKICDELQTQNSAYRLNQLLPLIYDTTSSIADYMPHDTVIVLNEPIRVMESAENEYKLFADNVRNILENDDGGTYLWELMCEPSHAISALNQQRLLMLSAFTTQFPHVSPKCIVQIDSPAMTSYMENDELFLHEMRSFTDNEYSVIIFAGRRAKGIEKLLVDSAIPVRYKETLESEKDVMYKGITVLPESLPYGFEYREIKFAVITENELYGLSMHRKQAYSGKSHRKSAEKLELSKLSPGDYVVHEVHGIGRFMGVQEEEIDGRKHDYIVIEYAGTDRLSIPCEQLHCIQKYIGTGDTPPKLSKFASKDWTNTLARVRQSVKKLAFDLVALYGERMDKAGFSYSEDTAMQKQLEMSFPYDETPDQLTAIADIKHDMQSDKVMDRLLCGDVGFGKTEVALRAAFKAVMDCKQVAFLVPTTVLAYQHYNTLRSRYAHFGVRVDYISRFKSKKEIDETLVKLKNGEIDVIIGTHRLLSKDVQFFDLGLLIIDEEQRFGVGHKELIKELKRNIDVLTMTATPIPRTMHMSLIGIRDISLLDTPPKQRYPVQTFVTEYSDSILRDAVMKEVSRGGQVYVMYNNVRDMPRFYAHICELLPDVRISYAHGQMDEALLEHTMLDFIDGKFDVLLSSTIIENGLDVPNANTMIVLDSDKLGLSQMYQLRGRVGRSKKIGFTYFTYAQNKVLSEVSAKRLASIAQFTQLGSGYKIAMRDLQIRGAGDVLGAQQSGHMEAIGYEMYRKLISEAVDEARGYSKPKKTADTRVEVPLDAYIPKTYIANEEQRLQMYKRISHVKDKDDYLDVQDELIDRFGDMPKAVQNLMNVALLKAISGECYITYLSIRADSVFMRFEKNAPYDIARIMDFVTQHRAKLSNDGGMSMLLPEKNADKAKVCATLSKTLTELKKCLEG
ncbi:MAG: transcription-repair coupling factor, partial [Clostridia bacterium]|nr:transcription-repair coupling factor [Clostridia bacterium]